jgi:hypothetical protein
MREVVLTTTFDIDQDSQLLQWSFTVDGEPITGTGVETGLLAFKREDKVSVVMIATSKKAHIAQVTIDDCNMITTPRAFTLRENPELAGQFPTPSPFGSNSAVISYGKGVCQGSSEVAVWQPTLTLECTNLGRWDLSFIITTSIRRTTSAGVEGIERRVFGFDPECEVGSGSD